MSRANTRRIAIALTLGGVLLVSWPAVSGGLLWDVGIACGYVCLILFLCLYVYPVRGDGLPHARLLGMSQHKTIGWCVLAAAVAHVAVVLLIEPRSTRYLLPSAPLFMWCGVVALLVLVASVVTGLSARAWMRGARGSSAGGATTAGAARSTQHLVLAAALMLTTCAHAIGSSQLLGGILKPAIVLLLLCLPLGWYSLRKRPRGGVGAGPAGASHVSAKRATGNAPPAWGAKRTSHIAAVAVVALLPTPLSKHLLLEPVAKPAPIPVSFPHDSHTSVACVTCHHNYIDHTGGTTACIECHRSARTDLVHSSEATFHTFCRECHTQLALDGQPHHGPTRNCAGCHRAAVPSTL